MARWKALVKVDCPEKPECRAISPSRVAVRARRRRASSRRAALTTLSGVVPDRLEHPRKVARAQAGDRGEVRHGQVAVEVGRNLCRRGQGDHVCRRIHHRFGE